MAATTIYCGNFDFAALSGTSWWAMGIGGGNIPAQAGRPSLIHSAGVADRVGIMVTTNDRTTASTFTTQVNGVAGAVSITIPAGQTGFFEDAVNTDTIAAGDEYKGVFAAGTGGTDLRVANVRYRWTPTAAAGITLHSDGINPGSGTLYTAIGGWLSDLGSTTESVVQVPVAAGTLRRLQISMRANDKPASTVTLRVNGVDTAIVVTIPGSTLGTFEDAVNSVVVADGDLVSLRWDIAAGGTTWRTWRHQVTHDATDAVSASGAALGPGGSGLVIPAGASRYGPPNLGFFASATRAQDSPVFRARVATPTVVEECWVRVTANAATADSFFRLLKNQVSVASVTIPAGLTGVFSFAPGTTFADGDDIGWEIDAGAGGDLTVSANAFRLAPAAAGTAVSQSVQAAVEVLARPVSAVSTPVELLQHLIGASAVAAETLASASAAVTPAVESFGSVDREVIAPWASEQHLDVVQLVPWESLAAVTASRTSALESLSTRAASAPSALEILARVAREIAAPLEALGSAGAVSQSVVAAIEWLQRLAVAPAVSVEALSRVAVALPADHESLQGLSAAVTAPWATDQRLDVARMVSWESLAGVSSSRLVAIESLAPVAAASPSALEILAGLSRAGVAPVESLARISRADVTSLEGLARVAGPLPAPWEALGGVSRSQVAEIEGLASLLAAHGTSIEMLRAVSQAQGVPIETLLRLAVLSVVPLETLGSPFISRLLREIDRSGHRLTGVDLSAHRLADRDHSAPHLTDTDHSGVSS